MENKYEFFIAGRARNKENILKIWLRDVHFGGGVNSNDLALLFSD